MCEIGDQETLTSDKYLITIDICLHDNDCLSYHQKLTYLHKINQARLMNKKTQLYTSETENSSLDDLKLAEINYLCIQESMQEVNLAARQNMFNYCIDHLKVLFEAGKFD